MTDSQARDAVLKMLGKTSLADFELTECSFTLTSSPITAPVRRLRAIWTFEEDQTVEVEVDPSAEEALKKILASLV